MTRKPVLTLKKPGPKADEEREFVIDFVDLLLPCRQYLVTHKVAEVGAVSLVTEFLLRLIHATEEINEGAVAAFFGFDAREMNFALADLQANAYVIRQNGTLLLTDAGRALFQHSQSTPQIYTVQSRTAKQGFDLISFAPQDFVGLSQFEMKLEELVVTDIQRVSTSSSEITASFRRFFSEIAAKGERDFTKSPTLYSIDSVSPDRRFSVPISFLIKAKSTQPNSPEPDLSLWRNPQDIDDRPQIVEGVAGYIDNLRVGTRTDDKYAYSILLELAGDYLKDFIRKDAFATDRYFNFALSRAGELRIDRPTVPIVGTFFTPENNARLMEGLSYGLKGLPTESPRPGLAWLVPAGRWGLTRALPTTLAGLAATLGYGDWNPGPGPTDCKAVALTRDYASGHVEQAFNAFDRPEDLSFLAPALEILWIPRVPMGALVHAPVKTLHGVPIPLGFLSFDPVVISRAEALLSKSFVAAADLARSAIPAPTTDSPPSPSSPVQPT